MDMMSDKLKQRIGFDDPLIDGKGYSVRASAVSAAAGAALIRDSLIWGIGMRDDRHEDRQRKKSLIKGVTVEKDKEKLNIEMDVSVAIGHDFFEICENAQVRVKEEIEKITDLEVGRININVVSVFLSP